MIINVDSITNPSDVLAAGPDGRDVAELAVKLGLATEAHLRSSTPRRAFRATISQLAPAQLSDEQGYWAGEYGRICELIGILNGQKKLLALQYKKDRARARGRVRAEADRDGSKKPTAAEVEDQAMDDLTLVETEELGAANEMLLAMAEAAKEATATHLTTISREISFRTAQMNARL